MMSHLLDRHLVVINQFMMATTKRRGKDFNLTITRTFVVSSSTSTPPPPSPPPPTNLKNTDMMHRQRNTGYIIDLDKLSIHEDATNK